MTNYLLSVLFSFQALLPLEAEAVLADSEQAVDVILSDMSLLGYAVPVESFSIGLFIFLFTYFWAEYAGRLQSREKFKIAMNMLHTIDTPLSLLRNQLEDLKDVSLPESVSRKVEEALRYTECIIDCNRNVVTLDRVDDKLNSKASTVHLELSSYINSVVNQCKAYASARRIRLAVCQCPECVSCKINENIMTAALQHLLNRMILITDSGCSISIDIMHAADSWKLRISNHGAAGEKPGKKFPLIPVMFPVYGYGNLWTVRKIIRLHGGKITGHRHGKAVTFQIAIPADRRCGNRSCPVNKRAEASAAEHAGKSFRIRKGGEQPSVMKDVPHLLLVMADELFSGYLKKSLSRYFRISTLENPDLLLTTVIRQNPDAVIIDDTVNGISGDSLCFQIKADKAAGDMPTVLLIRSADNESYLSHLGSGADRLELRTESICKFRADIRMLIENHAFLRERIKIFLSDAISPVIPVKEENENEGRAFLEKVNEMLETNLTTDKYTIRKLSADVGMSRTSFYSKMREVTGKSPEDYIYSFKMDKALKLLASRQFSISEIATMLGYCDAKYFGKKFKDFYRVCPTDYIKSIIG